MAMPVMHMFLVLLHLPWCAIMFPRTSAMEQQQGLLANQTTEPIATHFGAHSQNVNATIISQGSDHRRRLEVVRSVPTTHINGEKIVSSIRKIFGVHLPTVSLGCTTAFRSVLFPMLSAKSCPTTRLVNSKITLTQAGQGNDVTFTTSDGGFATFAAGGKFLSFSCSSLGGSTHDSTLPRRVSKGSSSFSGFVSFRLTSTASNEATLLEKASAWSLKLTLDKSANRMRFTFSAQDLGATVQYDAVLRVNREVTVGFVVDGGDGRRVDLFVDKHLVATHFMDVDNVLKKELPVSFSSGTSDIYMGSKLIGRISHVSLYDDAVMHEHVASVNDALCTACLSSMPELSSDWKQPLAVSFTFEDSKVSLASPVFAAASKPADSRMRLLNHHTTPRAMAFGNGRAVFDGSGFAVVSDSGTTFPRLDSGFTVSAKILLSSSAPTDLWMPIFVKAASPTIIYWSVQIRLSAGGLDVRFLSWHKDKIDGQMVLFYRVASTPVSMKVGFRFDIKSRILQLVWNDKVVAAGKVPDGLKGISGDGIAPVLVGGFVGSAEKFEFIDAFYSPPTGWPSLVYDFVSVKACLGGSSHDLVPSGGVNWKQPGVEIIHWGNVLTLSNTEEHFPISQTSFSVFTTFKPKSVDPATASRGSLVVKMGGTPLEFWYINFNAWNDHVNQAELVFQSGHANACTVFGYFTPSTEKQTFGFSYRYPNTVTLYHNGEPIKSSENCGPIPLVKGTNVYIGKYVTGIFYDLKFFNSIVTGAQYASMPVEPECAPKSLVLDWDFTRTPSGTVDPLVDTASQNKLNVFNGAKVRDGALQCRGQGFGLSSSLTMPPSQGGIKSKTIIVDLKLIDNLNGFQGIVGFDSRYTATTWTPEFRNIITYARFHTRQFDLEGWKTEIPGTLAIGGARENLGQRVIIAATWNDATGELKMFRNGVEIVHWTTHPGYFHEFRTDSRVIMCAIHHAGSNIGYGASHLATADIYRVRVFYYALSPQQVARLSVIPASVVAQDAVIRFSGNFVAEPTPSMFIILMPGMADCRTSCNAYPQGAQAIEAGRLPINRLSNLETLPYFACQFYDDSGSGPWFGYRLVGFGASCVAAIGDTGRYDYKGYGEFQCLCLRSYDGKSPSIHWLTQAADLSCQQTCAASGIDPVQGPDGNTLCRANIGGDGYRPGFAVLNDARCTVEWGNDVVQSKDKQCACIEGNPQPTPRPTKEPTKKPTGRPTTQSPTKRPTIKPTKGPSTSPTKRPTDFPTQSPVATMCPPDMVANFQFTPWTVVRPSGTAVSSCPDFNPVSEWAWKRQLLTNLVAVDESTSVAHMDGSRVAVVSGSSEIFPMAGVSFSAFVTVQVSVATPTGVWMAMLCKAPDAVATAEPFWKLELKIHTGWKKMEIRFTRRETSSSMTEVTSGEIDFDSAPMTFGFTFNAETQLLKVYKAIKGAPILNPLNKDEVRLTSDFSGGNAPLTVGGCGFGNVKSTNFRGSLSRIVLFNSEVAHNNVPQILEKECSECKAGRSWPEALEMKFVRRNDPNVEAKELEWNAMLPASLSSPLCSSRCSKDTDTVTVVPHERYGEVAPQSEWSNLLSLDINVTAPTQDEKVQISGVKVTIKCALVATSSPSTGVFKIHVVVMDGAVFNMGNKAGIDLGVHTLTKPPISGDAVRASDFCCVKNSVQLETLSLSSTVGAALLLISEPRLVIHVESRPKNVWLAVASASGKLNVTRSYYEPLSNSNLNKRADLVLFKGPELRTHSKQVMCPKGSFVESVRASWTLVPQIATHGVQIGCIDTFTGDRKMILSSGGLAVSSDAAPDLKCPTGTTMAGVTLVKDLTYPWPAADVESRVLRAECRGDFGFASAKSGYGVEFNASAMGSAEACPLGLRMCGVYLYTELQSKILSSVGNICCKNLVYEDRDDKNEKMSVFGSDDPKCLECVGNAIEVIDSKQKLRLVMTLGDFLNKNVLVGDNVVDAAYDTERNVFGLKSEKKAVNVLPCQLQQAVAVKRSLFPFEPRITSGSALYYSPKRRSFEVVASARVHTLGAVRAYWLKDDSTVFDPSSSGHLIGEVTRAQAEKTCKETGTRRLLMIKDKHEQQQAYELCRKKNVAAATSNAECWLGAKYNPNLRIWQWEDNTPITDAAVSNFDTKQHMAGPPPGADVKVGTSGSVSSSTKQPNVTRLTPEDFIKLPCLVLDTTDAEGLWKPVACSGHASVVCGPPEYQITRAGVSEKTLALSCVPNLNVYLANEPLYIQFEACDHFDALMMKGSLLISTISVDVMVKTGQSFMLFGDGEFGHRLVGGIWHTWDLLAPDIDLAQFKSVTTDSSNVVVVQMNALDKQTKSPIDFLCFKRARLNVFHNLLYLPGGVEQVETNSSVLQKQKKHEYIQQFVLGARCDGNFVQWTPGVNRMALCNEMLNFLPNRRVNNFYEIAMQSCAVSDNNMDSHMTRKLQIAPTGSKRSYNSNKEKVVAFRDQPRVKLGGIDESTLWQGGDKFKFYYHTNAAQSDFIASLGVKFENGAHYMTVVYTLCESSGQKMAGSQKVKAAEQQAKDELIAVLNPEADLDDLWLTSGGASENPTKGIYLVVYGTHGRKQEKRLSSLAPGSTDKKTFDKNIGRVTGIGFETIAAKDGSGDSAFGCVKQLKVRYSNQKSDVDVSSILSNGKGFFGNFGDLNLEVGRYVSKFEFPKEDVKYDEMSKELGTFCLSSVRVRDIDNGEERYGTLFQNELGSCKACTDGTTAYIEWPVCGVIIGACEWVTGPVTQAGPVGDAEEAMVATCENKQLAVEQECSIHKSIMRTHVTDTATTSVNSTDKTTSKEFNWGFNLPKIGAGVNVQGEGGVVGVATNAGFNLELKLGAELSVESPDFHFDWSKGSSKTKVAENGETISVSTSKTTSIECSGGIAVPPQHSITYKLNLQEANAVISRYTCTNRLRLCSSLASHEEKPKTIALPNQIVKHTKAMIPTCMVVFEQARLVGVNQTEVRFGCREHRKLAWFNGADYVPKCLKNGMYDTCQCIEETPMLNGVCACFTEDGLMDEQHGAAPITRGKSRKDTCIELGCIDTAIPTKYPTKVPTSAPLKSSVHVGSQRDIGKKMDQEMHRQREKFSNARRAVNYDDSTTVEDAFEERQHDQDHDLEDEVSGNNNSARVLGQNPEQKNSAHDGTGDRTPKFVVSAVAVVAVGILAVIFAFLQDRSRKEKNGESDVGDDGEARPLLGVAVEERAVA